MSLASHHESVTAWKWWRTFKRNQTRGWNTLCYGWALWSWSQCLPQTSSDYFLLRAQDLMLTRPLYRRVQPCFIWPLIDFILLRLHFPHILFCHAIPLWQKKKNPEYGNSCITTHPSIVIICCSFMRWPLEGVTLPTIIYCVQKVCACHPSFCDIASVFFTFLYQRMMK